MAYSPRLTVPSNSNKYYFSNTNIFYACGYGMPNCTCYAWGRFYELSQSRPQLSTANAGEWYGYKGDPYERGNTPKLGAVMCWYGGTDGGHVAVVEEIYSDGSVLTSNSAWGGAMFYTQKLSPPNYTWSSSFHFQGFIYNPAVTDNSVSPTSNKLQEFVNEALSHKGEGGTWSWATSGLGVGQPWCAAFIIACAKTVGILGSVFPDTGSKFTAAGIPRDGVKLGMGTFLKGPWFGEYPKPQIGDCFVLRQGISGGDVYNSDHIGIIASVASDGQSYTTIEGNSTNGVVSSHTYSIKYKTVSGYYRPDWSKVGGSVSPGGFMTAGPLYTTESTREDAVVREVCYIKDQSEPSISSTDIKLSIINYTSVFGALYEALGGMASPDYSSDSVDISGITNPNAKVIAEFLLDKGLTAAMTVGFLANIQAESNFQPDAVNPSSGASGICQWLGVRRSEMIKFVGSNWRNNLTGQCNFLWYELNNAESRTLQCLKSDVTENTEDGALEATDIVLYEFERPGNDPAIRATRQSYAKKLWSQIVVQIGSSTILTDSTNATFKSQNGKTLSPVKTVPIPASVNQAGITGNYTSYTYFYSLWSSGTIQRQLADIWHRKGRLQNRNIATINGYYLCAVTLKLGTTGDAITIVLEDGICINCIVGDSKGSNPGLSGESGNEYGHSLGGGLIDIVEWERVGDQAIDLTGWRGKKVAKVINYGSWLR